MRFAQTLIYAEASGGRRVHVTQLLLIRLALTCLRCSSGQLNEPSHAKGRPEEVVNAQRLANAEQFLFFHDLAKHTPLVPVARLLDPKATALELEIKRKCVTCPHHLSRCAPPSCFPAKVLVFNNAMLCASKKALNNL